MTVHAYNEGAGTTSGQLVQTREKVNQERKNMTEERGTCKVPGCERPATETGIGECAEHGALFEARADEEAWGLAWNILKPWLESARYIGSDELTKAMEIAFGHVEDRVTISLDAVDRAEAALVKEEKK